MLLYVAMTSMLFMILACNLSLYIAFLFPLILTAILAMYIAYQAMLLPEGLLQIADDYIIKLDKFKDEEKFPKAHWREQMDSQKVQESIKQIEDQDNFKFDTEGSKKAVKDEVEGSQEQQDNQENILADQDENTSDIQEENPTDVSQEDIDEQAIDAADQMLDTMGYGDVEDPQKMEQQLPDFIDNSALDIFIYEEDKQVLIDIEDTDTQIDIGSRVADLVSQGSTGVLIQFDENKDEWSITDYSIDSQDIDEEEEV